MKTENMLQRFNCIYFLFKPLCYTTLFIFWKKSILGAISASACFLSRSYYRKNDSPNVLLKLFIYKKEYTEEKKTKHTYEMIILNYSVRLAVALVLAFCTCKR